MIQLSDRPIMHEETCVCGARVTLRMPHGNTYPTQERLLDERIAAWRDAHEVCRERDTWTPPTITAGGYSVTATPVVVDYSVCIDSEDDHCECYYATEEGGSVEHPGRCCHCNQHFPKAADDGTS